MGGSTNVGEKGRLKEAWYTKSGGHEDDAEGRVGSHKQILRQVVSEKVFGSRSCKVGR